MGWHLVEKFLEQVAEHSTLIGKFWVTFFFVLRLLLVVSIADNIFEDEQESFVCNTQTPGCENVCFNDFSPISLIRLWALQILAVALPTIIFMIYTAHKLTKIDHAKKLKKEMQEKKKKEKEEKKKRMFALEYERSPPEYTSKPNSDLVERKKSEDESEEKKDEKKDDKKNEEKICASKLDSDTPSKLLLAYVAQIVFRLAADIGFLIFQMKIYVFQFWVPELFKCSRFPCPNAVDCFVSRPKEKTVALWVMFASSVVMIILNFVEIYHLGITKIWEAWATRHQDITKEYKLKNNMPTFAHFNAGGHYGARYPRGYPQAVGIRVGYARSSISGAGNDFDGDQFI